MDKELLELVFDNVENGIYIVDGQGVTVGVNRTFEEMSGFSNAELAGRSLYDLVGPDNYFSGSASLLVLERKAPVTATYSTRTKRKLLVGDRVARRLHRRRSVAQPGATTSGVWIWPVSPQPVRTRTQDSVPAFTYV
jgi:PAS domain S-box-containing protein